MRQDDAVEAPVGAEVEEHELAVGLSLDQRRLNVLVRVRAVVIRALRARRGVRTNGECQEGRQREGFHTCLHGPTCGPTTTWRTLRVFDIRERLSRSLGVASVHVNLYGSGRDVEAAGEPPEPDQVLQALALAYERYTRGFECPFREREGYGVRGLEDCDHFGLSHVPGYFPRNSRRKPTVSMVPCAMTDTQRLRPVTKYKSPNTNPPNPAAIMPDAP